VEYFQGDPYESYWIEKTDFYDSEGMGGRILNNQWTYTLEENKFNVTSIKPITVLISSPENKVINGEILLKRKISTEVKW
jgi:hypothetical protein